MGAGCWRVPDKAGSVWKRNTDNNQDGALQMSRLRGQRVDTAEVAWCYLAHEYMYKKRHSNVSNALGLVGKSYPQHLTIERIIACVAIEVRDGRCASDVLTTLKQWEILEWEVVDVDGDVLGCVESQLPGEFEAQGSYDPGKQGAIRLLLPGWLDYLKLDRDKPREDAKTHAEILKTLASGPLRHRVALRDESTRTVIGDGRHRAFAAYQCLSTLLHPRLSVYWGRAACATISKNAASQLDI